MGTLKYIAPEARTPIMHRSTPLTHRYSRSDTRSRAYSKVGTLTYIAPEVLHNYGGGYDARKADVFSAGVVLYALLTGRFPYAAPPRDAPREEMAAGISRMLKDIGARRYQLPGERGFS